MMVTVWVGMSATQIFGPYFYEDSDSGDAVTVTKETYLAMLQQVFNEETLMELNDHWYQQDGAPAHSSKVVLDWLETSFPQRLISIKSSFPWPANSPDLNPLDFLSMGVCEARGFCRKSAEHQRNQRADQKHPSCDGARAFPPKKFPLRKVPSLELFLPGRFPS